jgi:hypothetical protein
LTFSLPFLPLGTTTLHVSDIVGLIVIMAGIILYRFSDCIATCSFCKEDDDNVVDEVDDAPSNTGTAAAIAEPAPVRVVDDGMLLQNDDNNNNNGREDGEERKEDPGLLLIQPLRRTGDV